jgi:uridine kinase
MLADVGEGRPVGASDLQVEALAAAVRARLHPDGTPIVVGLDGRSGAGKSTLAAALRGTDVATRVTVIDGDDFYAGGSAAAWDARSAEQKADRVIDWRRQREVLLTLRAGRIASWRPFDWEADDWDTKAVPLCDESMVAEATPVVVLEGAYSCRPELHDLLDLRVLLAIPDEVRMEQLRRREGEAYRDEWVGRWAAAEEHYFGVVMPPDRFDLVLGEPVPGRDA